jgi:hypothetical protein
MSRKSSSRRGGSLFRTTNKPKPTTRRARPAARLLQVEDLECRIVPTLLGQQLFPSDYPWNQNIANAPVAANSAAIISHIGSSITVHPDWGEDSASNGASPLYGIPYNVVHGNSAQKINVIIDNYPGESDIVPVPMPANGVVIEGDLQNGPNLNGPGYNMGQRGDSHLLIWDEDNNVAYELFGVTRPADPNLFPDRNGVEHPHTDGLWHAAQESVWHMSAEDFRTLGATSADAAGLSILAGLARPDEGLGTLQGGQGAINHALRFTLPSGDVSNQYIYPASHMVSDSPGSTKLPFGARLRLMDTPAINAQIEVMGPEAQVIAAAMQQYGLVLADIGSAMYVTGTSASETANNTIGLTWNMNDVLGLAGLTAGDFEVVNLAPTVSGLSQTSGSAGTKITITGQNFSGSAGHLSVFFGTQASPSVSYVDDAHITAVVPAGTGTVDVTVQSGVNETDTISSSPSANVNAPIFGYGTSATNANDRFNFAPTLPATHLSASAPANDVAGMAFSFTVTALDMNNGTAAGYGGTVHFTSSDPMAVLPADYTFKASDLGSHTFQITPGKSGSETYTVSDTPDGLGSASAMATVAPGAASLSLSTVTAPSTIRAGQSMTVTLTARDAFGNAETSGGLTVTFALSGMAGGTFGPVMDNANGTYSAVFTAKTAGSGSIIGSFGGKPLTSMAPSVTVTADSAPVIQPIANVTLPHDQFPDTVTVNAMSPVGNTLTLSASAVGDSLLYDLESRYHFMGITVYTNSGTTAYVVKAASNNVNGNPFYLIRPSDGGLFAYAGGTYAATFANSANLVATLGSNVFTDPMLLLNAQAPIDYATLSSLEQQLSLTGVQYYTSGGITAYVLQAPSNNANGNPFYLLRSADGALFAYGGGTYAATFANPNNLIATLGMRVFNNPSLLTNSGASLSLYNQLYQLNQQYDLQEMGGTFDINMLGHGAEWFFSPVLNQFAQHWYTLTLQTVSGSQQAVLTAWQGYADSEVGAVVATLPTSVYSHPMWLSMATAVANPPSGTVSIDQAGHLALNLPSAGFVGMYNVTVTASDGLLSSSQTFSVTSTDPSPSLTVQQGANTIANGSTQTFPHLSFPQTFTVTGSSTDSADTVTVSASASNYSQLFALQQRYRFMGLQYFTNAGNAAYVLQAAGNNRNGNPIYLLRSTDGDLFAYAGGTYAATFADPNNLIATLGVNVYADPMLLTNALPALDYATLYNLEQQFHFQGLQFYSNNGVPAYVLQASSNNANGNPFYLLATNGGLYAYGGGTYAATFANPANLVATLDPQLYLTPSLLTMAQATPPLYTRLQAAEASLDLKGLTYYVSSGVPAYVLQAPVNNAFGNPFYLLSAAGGLYAYDGSGSYAHTFANGSNLLTTSDPSVYTNPSLLVNAKAPLAATGVTASVSGGMLTVNAPASFVGTFQVAVTASDGIQSTTQTFLVTSTDAPPVPNTIPTQPASRSGSPLQVTLGASNANHDPMTFTASATGYSPAYNLQQTFHFKGMGYATTMDGVTAYVMSVTGNNANGNPFYLISSNGGVYAYDGSGSYAHTFANSANLVAMLSPAVYMNPSMLLAAMAPSAVAALVNVSGNMLTVNVANVPVGTVFQVNVTARDGAESSVTSFLVTVTA